MPSLHSALKPRIYGAACLLPLLSLAPGYTLAQSTDAPASSTSENLSKPRATKSRAPAPTRAPTLTQQVQLLQSRLEAQAQEIQALRERLDTQVSQHDELQRQMQAQQGGATAVAEGGYRSPSAANAVPAATAAVGMAPPDPGGRAVRVGTAPPEPEAPLQVAQIFEQPGILTQPGHYVLEPSVQYGYSSSNRVALVGYTVIPALLIGLVDVREVKRNTLTMALTGRFGLTKRLEGEIRIPYVSRRDDSISREIFTGSASERAFSNRGNAIGDVELALRYQLNEPQANKPYLIAGLRFKTRTGKDPFDVVTDCVTRCIGNTTGTGMPLELPTGSGFNSLQTSLTWLLPSDPAVFFGSVSYTHNFGRSGVSRTVLNGEKEYIGSVKPGDVLGINFGMGLALNDRSSFSLGVELNTVGRTKQNGTALANAVRIQLASLLLGYSYRYSPRTTINVSVGAGLTRDTPDLSLSVRVPMSF
ncbi:MULTISPECIES: hypothetical protein [Comamonas]|uniref:Acetate kinase n=1 Tax=Comamonas terrigena TaxID=32013 RepID=A0A2A7UUM5_COMTR|nr:MULTISPECIES: hypothetical protein [Comamonas]MBD9530132.1 acetate kinase [Comamonas sp. CMM01]MDH1293441.1 acetate kinase [Comamonas terrigena]PEH88896.1 acetate kinase [Comamonas terrigena]SUY72436.1 Uncharacterised protein [Comamonas terrigena]BBL23964.1 hypothetical protein CT3_14190 [Comamonas terrigena NBRC 13299]